MTGSPQLLMFSSRRVDVRLESLVSGLASKTRIVLRSCFCALARRFPRAACLTRLHFWFPGAISFVHRDATVQLSSAFVCHVHRHRMVTPGCSLLHDHRRSPGIQLALMLSSKHYSEIRSMHNLIRLRHLSRRSHKSLRLSLASEHAGHVGIQLLTSCRGVICINSGAVGPVSFMARMARDYPHRGQHLGSSAPESVDPWNILIVLLRIV